MADEDEQETNETEPEKPVDPAATTLADAPKPDADDRDDGKKLSGAQRRAMNRLEARIAQLEDAFAVLGNHVAMLEGILQDAMPAAARAFTTETVRAIVAENPNAVFEVLEEYKPGGFGGGKWAVGRQIKASSYPHLLEYVKKGLRLGVPRDQARHIEKMREQIDMNVKAARASTAAIEAHRHEAQAAVDAAHATQAAEDARAASTPGVKIPAGKRSVHAPAGRPPPTDNVR